MQRSTSLLALALAGCASHAQPPQAPAGPLSDFAFLSGRWIGVDGGPEDGGLETEEIWGVPLGDTLSGISTLRVGGNTVLIELFAIEQRGDEIVLVLRHFDPGLVMWETERAPNGALEYPLIEHAANRAVFETKERSEHNRLVYSVEGDVLEVRLESDDGTEPLVFELPRS